MGNVIEKYIASKTDWWCQPCHAESSMYRSGISRENEIRKSPWDTHRSDIIRVSYWNLRSIPGLRFIRQMITALYRLAEFTATIPVWILEMAKRLATLTTKSYSISKRATTFRKTWKRWDDYRSQRSKVKTKTRRGEATKSTQRECVGIRSCESL